MTAEVPVTPTPRTDAIKTCVQEGVMDYPETAHQALEALALTERECSELRERLEAAQKERDQHRQAAHEADMRTQAAVRGEKAAEASLKSAQETVARLTKERDAARQNEARYLWLRAGLKDDQYEKGLPATFAFLSLPGINNSKPQSYPIVRQYVLS